MDINPPLIVCVCVHSVLSNSCNPMDYSPPGLLCPWGFSGKSTGVGCHFFLQRIFPTQGLSHISGVSCRAGRFFTTEPAGKPLLQMTLFHSFLWMSNVPLYDYAYSLPIPLSMGNYIVSMPWLLKIVCGVYFNGGLKEGWARRLGF